MLVLDRAEAEVVVDGDHRGVGLGVPGVDRGGVLEGGLEGLEVGQFERQAEAVAAVFRPDEGG
ncbi:MULTISPECIES: hypothetical protein [Kribbella]|uniref:hypothetical protein n=1 Tax=Kribbella TaxID=182639 RepID=UPI0018EE629A|nr:MULTISPECIES: hypothetical protein [Kribbella]